MSEASSHTKPKTILFDIATLYVDWKETICNENNFGLQNFGNTCYLNSIVQTLFSLPVFVRWIQSEAHDTCHNECTICLLKKLLCSGNVNILKCLYFVVLKLFNKRLHLYRQEALIIMLDLIKSDFLCRIECANRLDEFSVRTNPVDTIFGGYIKTKVVCFSCEKESTSYNGFNQLALDIESDLVKSTNDALKHYFDFEILDDYQCTHIERP